MSAQPPKLALKVLNWFCPEYLIEGIEGDLIERYEEDREKRSELKATGTFYWNVLRFFHYEILFRNKFKLKIITTMMLTNYLKIGYRQLMKRRLYSFINTFGLSIGLAFCILIYLFIRDEKSFDQFHENKERIYRMETYSYQLTPDGEGYGRGTYIQTGLLPALLEECPQVEKATRYNYGEIGIVRHENVLDNERIAYVDADFFQIFSFELIAGNKDKLFTSPLEVVITPAIARKYFGDENPLDKTLVIDVEGQESYTVTGIIEEAPGNSSLYFDIILPQEKRPYFERNLTRWGSHNTRVLVQMVSNADMQSFDQNLAAIVDKHLRERIERRRERNNFPADMEIFKYTYSPMSSWHLDSEVGWYRGSDAQYSLILGGIASLILLIACINYLSLALTNSASRRTEVGVRKAIGAYRRQLMNQFTLESILLAFISMTVGIALVVLALPTFNEFTDKSMVISSAVIFELLAIGIFLSLVVGLIAGSYPSFYLSNFKPAIALKSSFSSKLNAGFTKYLVMIQFALAIFLITSSIVMYKQMEFISRKDLGFNKDQLLVIPTQEPYSQASNMAIERYRQALSQISGVKQVAGASMSVSSGTNIYGYMIDGERRRAHVFGVDASFLDLMELELVEGRNFSGEIASDTTALIVNEALVKDMGWEDPLSEYLNWRRDTIGPGFKIIGVVKDYHFRALTDEIEPMFLSLDHSEVGYLMNMLVKIEAGDMPTTIEAIKDKWQELSPDKPFDYRFVDDDVANQYESFNRWMSIMGLSTLFAILITCLGLFALAAINAINRTKEMGIRKIMGAEVSSIFVLLNRQYLAIVSLAFVVGAPASWYVMVEWLQSFQFGIAIGWQIYGLSLLLGLLIVLLTVSYHALRVANLSPSNTLRYE